MQPLRLNKIAERVILLQTDKTRGVVPVTLFKKKRKKSKNNSMMRPATVVKRMRDMGGNVFEAVNSVSKSMGMPRLPF